VTKQPRKSQPGEEPGQERWSQDDDEGSSQCARRAARFRGATATIAANSAAKPIQMIQFATDAPTSTACGTEDSSIQDNPE